MVKFLKLVAFLFIQILGIYCIAQAASIDDLEYQKFTTDSDGNPAIRIVLPDGGGTVGSANAISQLNSNVTVTDAADGYITMTEDGTEYVRLTGGNFGLGTTIPSAKLEIQGNTRSSGTLSINNDLTARNSFVTSMTAGYVPYFNSKKQAVISPAFSDGTNVGIGTTTPTKKLVVTGDTAISGNLSVDSVTARTVTAGSGSADGVLSSGGSNIIINDNVQVNGNITASGYAGIPFWQDVKLSVDASRFTVNNAVPNRICGGLMDVDFLIKDAKLFWDLTPDGEISIELYENTTLVKELTVSNTLRTGYLKSVNTTFNDGNYWSVRLKTLGDSTNSSDPTRNGTLKILGYQTGAN